jgi:hypothetical protein
MAVQTAVQPVAQVLAEPPLQAVVMPAAQPIQPVLIPESAVQTVIPEVPVHPSAEISASVSLPYVPAPPVPTVEVESVHDVSADLDDLTPPPPPKPMRISRPDQTQMINPIEIDQTQMVKPPKSHADKKAVTIQDLDVGYEVTPFMSPLEIVYYKLLRAALSGFLIFPNVICRSVVKASSKLTEHQKIADNVLNGTSLSFIVCDVKLNIKAVVEVIDESRTPSNKDKARNYILKKVGLVLLRFYSGDRPPDTETIRRNILG